MRYTLALAIVCGWASAAAAWNDLGHMVVARLAWMRLDADERAAVVEILQHHPHYEEYLAEEKPRTVSEAEWVFLRAATWSDWVRSNHRQRFHRGNWHYINLAYVPPASALDERAWQIPEPNVVTQIHECLNVAKNSDNADERAVRLTWLFHLVGDIHQPCHTTALVSEQFPRGDRGGNSIQVRFGVAAMNIHWIWDWVLGSGRTFAEVTDTAAEISRRQETSAEAGAGEPVDPLAWAAEGRQLAEEYVYLRGALEFADVRDNVPVAALPTLPSGYLQESRKIAQRAAGKAVVRLAEVLREVVAEPDVAQEATLRDRLLSEGPVGWAKLADARKQIVARGASVTRSVGVEPLHEVPRNEEWEMMRNGEMVRAIRVRRRDDGTVDTAAMVFGPKFGFVAVKIDDADYNVVSMGPNRGQIDGFVGNGIGAYLNASWFFLGRSFAELLKIPQVTLGDVTSVEEAGRTLVKAEFRYTPGEKEATKLSGNAFLFDPARHWALVRADLEFDGTRTRYVVEYGDDVEGLPTPKRVRWITPVDDAEIDLVNGPYHELRFAFQEVKAEEIAEKEFTLSAFGLADKKINIKGGRLRRKTPKE